MTLKVRMLEATGAPALACVLCHGYGAPGDDLVPIGMELRHVDGKLGSVAFAFPEAPLTIPGMPFGRAWWQIDVTRFERALVTGQLEQLFEEVPDGMLEARAQLQETVQALAQKLGLPMHKIVLGGFSQGAMISTDVALRTDGGPAALAILSGTLLARRDWTELAKKKAAAGPMPILQSHGMEDPILPFPAAKELERTLVAAGLPVEFISFRGGHGIHPNVIGRLAVLLSARLAGATS